MRCSENVVAYYEVFNEGLQHINAAGIGSVDYSSWASNHPSQAPYFLEFLPLLRPEGGVTGFDQSMAFGRFLPQNGLQGAISAEEQSYLETLIDHAHRAGRIPILTCTRSLGRIAAIRRSIPVYNIFLHRNIFHQWASYTGQVARGNDYFFMTIEETLKNCLADPFLCRVNSLFSGRRGTPDDEQTLTLFIVMHLYLYAAAFESADLVVDATALAKDRDLRRSIEHELSQLICSPIDLSDASSNFEMSLVTVRDRRSFTDTIEQFGKMVRAGCKTEESAQFVRRVQDDALAEWERHDDFTRQAVLFRYYGPVASSPGTPVTEGMTGADPEPSPAVERDRLAEKLAESAAACAAAQTAADTLTGVRDDLVAELAALAVERDRFRIALAECSAEHDAVRAHSEAVTADRGALSEQLAAVAGRDGVPPHASHAVAARGDDIA